MIIKEEPKYKFEFDKLAKKEIPIGQHVEWFQGKAYRYYDDIICPLKRRV